jgi:hypothetical protein
MTPAPVATQSEAELQETALTPVPFGMDWSVHVAPPSVEVITPGPTATQSSEVGHDTPSSWRLPLGLVGVDQDVPASVVLTARLMPVGWLKLTAVQVEIDPHEIPVKPEIPKGRVGRAQVVPLSALTKMDPSGTAVHWLVEPQDTPVNSVIGLG